MMVDVGLVVRDRVHAELDQLKEMMRGPVEPYDNVVVDRKVSEVVARLRQML